MLFNSVDFAIFFPIVLVLYWFVFNRSIRIQNLFLIAVSYIFYGFWDWRFLGLIFLSSMVDYTVGYLMNKGHQRKLLLIISLTVNLGILGFFKYYNFFVESFVDTFALFGKSLASSTVNIVLPVGISFYTFQTLSYTIDIYNKKIEPSKNLISFFAFVCFFPQLVAGPIERAQRFLPQFQKKRVFVRHDFTDGLRLILGGLFKKMVIADTCGLAVDHLFASYHLYDGSTMLAAAVLFGFQIYGDFSGYSDIAIGSARLLGFDLVQNFKYPYLSRNLREFWQRWHISLSTWFRDYVYIPLGGSKVSRFRATINIFIVFALSGLWHGANWTFVIWGLVHAICYMPAIFNKRMPGATVANKGDRLPSFKSVIQIGVTFLIVTFAWVFFRAESLEQATQIFNLIFSKTVFSIPQVSRGLLLFLFVYMILEWFQRDKKHVLDISFVKSKRLRYACYYIVIAIIFVFGEASQPFIYFQF